MFFGKIGCGGLMAWRLVNSQPKVGPPTPEAAIMHSNLAVRNGAVMGLTGIGGEFEKADIQHPTGTQSARHFAQVRSNTGVEVQISESPLYVPYLVDLLGLRDGVLPGVLLLSRRR
jgi:hypothetical protein